MICGSGFGGILAIMCGILKMTGDELVHEFVGLCKAVFSEDLNTVQRTAVFEKEIKRIIGMYSTDGEDRKMIGEHDGCRTFVCAAAFHNTGHPRLFRNYPSRTNPSIDCMLWEAACATLAMPDFFEPITLGDSSLRETFVGGEVRWSNPSDELTKEATNIFKDRRISSIVSIGSGHPGHLSLSQGLSEYFPLIALDCERVADEMERRFGNTPEVFWRLSVEQGLQHLAIELSNLDALISHTHSYLQSARTTRNIDTLIQDLIRRPERLPVDGISGIALGVSEILRRKPCPPPSQHFTGRLADLQKLEEHFFSDRTDRKSCRIAVLYGIGGGGKTQIGLEFIHQSHGRFTEVFFIDASDRFTLENDLKAIATEISDKPTVDDALHFLRTSKEEWLIFFDNADDTSLNLRPYVTWSHGNVLITTRNPEVRVHAPECSIWVDKLEMDDAKKLLLRGVAVGENSETEMVALEIVLELGCLALAVNQARAFLAQNICTLFEYLPIYMQNRRTLLEDKAIQTTDDYEHTVYTTWTLSFSKLSSTAALLLELLCFMHHDAIPSRIFEDAWKVFERQFEDAVPAILFTFLSSFKTPDSAWNILRFRMLIKEILSFSLIEFNANNQTLSLHPLVQHWAQTRCHHPQEIIHSAQTLLTLATLIPESKDDYAMVMSLLPHLRASAQNGLTVHFTLLHCAGHAYHVGGMFREGAKAFEQEQSEMQRVFGPEHPDTVTSMGNLASAYSKLGQHRDALKINEQVLALRTRTLGEKHPITLLSMNNLASTYSDLGQHRDALTMNEQVLVLSTQILGEKHRATLASMNNLALAYSDLGRHRDALTMKEQVRTLSAQILGEKHPLTLNSMSNLASTYSDLGQHRDALTMNEQILALRTQILGEKHPDTLTSMSNLASTYSDLGRHRDALTMKERVLAVSTEVLGEKHPDTLISMNNLASTYSDLGQILGEKHPATLTSMTNLASTYSNLGQHRDALMMRERVLAISTETLGEKHPATLNSMSNLASTYSDLGQHRDALKMDEQVLAFRTQILGEKHPDTLTSMTNLASTYSDLGQHRDALTMKERVLAVSAEILGEKHPDTLNSMNNLALTYSDLGQHKDALKMNEQVLVLRTHILGERHPATLNSMNNLASTYSDLGQHNDALRLHTEVLNLRKRILGPGHPDTIDSSQWVNYLKEL
ncbi:hypothetical protein DL96DRAFT_1782923 [Flagelloscypha sp. PMI_526]|nr:hypothetical protein DL96DRAFT_1782923 [Flagelloscypha sp. PMI_526]